MFSGHPIIVLSCKAFLLLKALYQFCTQISVLMSTNAQLIQMVLARDIAYSKNDFWQYWDYSCPKTYLIMNICFISYQQYILNQQLCKTMSLTLPHGRNPIHFQAIINCLDDAHELVDRAISTCLLESKPIYISVGCNLAGIVHPSFTRSTIPYAINDQ